MNQKTKWELRLEKIKENIAKFPPPTVTDSIDEINTRYINDWSILRKEITDLEVELSVLYTRLRQLSEEREMKIFDLTTENF